MQDWVILSLRVKQAGGPLSPSHLPFLISTDQYAGLGGSESEAGRGFQHPALWAPSQPSAPRFTYHISTQVTLSFLKE
jgi:hypothetical protein